MIIEDIWSFYVFPASEQWMAQQPDLFGQAQVCIQGIILTQWSDTQTLLIQASSYAVWTGQCSSSLALCLAYFSSGL
jgi:hypothetical protein